MLLFTRPREAAEKPAHLAMPGTRQPRAPPPRRQSPKCHRSPSTEGGSTEEWPGQGSRGSSPTDKLRPRAPLRPHSRGGKCGDRHSPELPVPLGGQVARGNCCTGRQAGRAGQARPGRPAPRAAPGHRPASLWLTASHLPRGGSLRLPREQRTRDTASQALLGGGLHPQTNHRSSADRQPGFELHP